MLLIKLGTRTPYKGDGWGEKMVREDYAIILDFLPNGYPFDPRPMFQKEPIAQAIGEQSFSLLELVPKKGVFLQPHERVYIGPERRDKIHHIASRIPYKKLTSTAKAELEFAIKEIIKNNEKRFVDFFNKAGPLTTRMHQLELLPGLGKKRMWDIIEERRVKPFESFDDLKKRVKLMPDPDKLIMKRILEELQEEQKHYLFVEPPRRREQGREGRGYEYRREQGRRDQGRGFGRYRRY